MIKEIHDLKQLKANGLSVSEMIDKLEGKDGEITKENMEKYQPKEQVISQLASKVNGFTFVIFCADWCGDCKTNVAAFAKIMQFIPEINAIFFKGLKSAPKDPSIRWRVPPSPPEVNDFDLRKIPTFYILNEDGKVVGEIIENPEVKPTLEEELVYILDKIQG
jgi:thiol-disulfide isomerase/thioredoxin